MGPFDDDLRPLCAVDRSIRRRLLALPAPSRGRADDPHHLRTASSGAGVLLLPPHTRLSRLLGLDSRRSPRYFARPAALRFPSIPRGGCRRPAASASAPVGSSS